MTEDRIKAYVTAQFPAARTRDLRNDEALLENGILDSLGIVEMISFLEEEFDIVIEDEELIPNNFQTIERIAAFVSSKQDSPS